MRKVWQYGCSISLGEEATKPYGQWIASEYEYDFHQQSESSASNPYIALKFCEQVSQITPEDLVIFGWSHPSRNSWYNKHSGVWDHLNFIQTKQDGAPLTATAKDYIVHSYEREGYLEKLHDWYPRHIVECTAKLNNISYLHIDMLPNGNNIRDRQFKWSIGVSAIEQLMEENKALYISDHLHPNDLGHKRIFELIKPWIDSIIHT